MDDMANAALHFSLNGIATTMLQLMVIIACIIVVTKHKKSIGVKLLLTGAILKLLGYLANFIFPMIANNVGGVESLIKSQIAVSYFNTFASLVFAIGFMMFAVNDLKKPVIN